MTRPTTSAGGRPSTSGRPNTARLDTADYFDRDPQYTYSIDEGDEYEEESDAEDVFAFARPPTAVTTPSQHSQYSQPSNVIYPPQAFHPAATFHQSVLDTPTAGPSGLHARHAYQYPQSPTVESPPSTDSQGADDPYRLKRLTYSASVLTGDGSRGSRRSGMSSSREVHVSLPTTREEPLEETVSVKLRPPSSATSFPSLDSRDGSIKMEFDFDAIEEEDSPYPEVRAAVSSIDDPEMPVLTFRMWVIGLFLTLTSSAANVFFNFRQPAPTIVPSVLLLLAYPMGKFLAFSLPITTYVVPKWLTFGNGPYSFSLNPGPWNIKEHALVFMMTNVGTTFPYALLAVSVAQKNYGAEDFGYSFSAVLVLATQMTGFGLAGLTRRFLIWPASMLWPENLVLCTLLNTFHAEEDADRGGLTRYRYFLYVSVAAFFWFFLPGYLFTALSFFNWVCWIAPRHQVLNQVFGVYNGLGFSVFTFDWTQITWNSNPLVVPWWAQVHTFLGFVLFYWVLAPALYYTNVWKLAYFPMLANGPYDRLGNPYNITRVLREDSTFDPVAFDNYSPLYLPASYAITYLVAFALSSCVVVHTFLYHGKAIWRGLGFNKIKLNWARRMLGKKLVSDSEEDERGDDWEKDDIHAKLMRVYPEVPNWWYWAVFFVFFSLCVVAIEVWHTGLPIWGLLLAMGIVGLYVVPSGFIYAMTSETLSTNLLAQIIPGVALPGKPIANMIFKAFVIQTLSEATSFAQDLKLGHYIKVPPRATFIVQITATLLAGFVQVGVKEVMFKYIPDICTPQQRSFLTCPVNQVYYTASAVWGLIGPSRQFGVTSIYHSQLYALIVGAFLPIPFWYWQRKYPNGWNKFISVPVFLNAVTFIPPATGINFSSAFLVGFIFQYLLRRKNFAWWSKFNYVTSAALDSGTLVSLLVIFFAFEVPKGGLTVSWWGNTVWRNTLDYRNEGGILPIPPDGL
ncbi:unnamed protein product [Somion occarium]|uniref:Oligopeptide transporter n=1 Tax=Somion occarium TaxID=3059160 RepID=A0ABP1DY18_9APHY